MGGLGAAGARLHLVLAITGALAACGPTNPAPAARPRAHRGAALAYLPSMDRFVLFGGATGDVFHPDGLNTKLLTGDTWLFGPESWERLDVTGPSPRAFAAMAYDPGRGELILFGGIADASPDCPSPEDGGFCHDTWSFDGAAWTKIASHPGHGRARHAMAYAPDEGALMVVGGLGPTREGLAIDPVFLHGPALRTTPRTKAQALHSVGLVWHERWSMMLLFGGLDEAGCDGRGVRNPLTFAWVSGQWRLLHPALHPGRSSAAWFFDQHLGQVVAHGGVTESGVCRGIEDYNGTSVFADSGWHAFDGEAPEPRLAAAVATDPTRGRTLLFGGFVNYYSGYGALHDTWSWRDGRWSQDD
jgi:hypothetical protein